MTRHTEILEEDTNGVLVDGRNTIRRTLATRLPHRRGNHRAFPKGAPIKSDVFECLAPIKTLDSPSSIPFSSTTSA